MLTWQNAVYLGLALTSVLLYSAAYPPVELSGLAWAALAPWLMVVFICPPGRQVIISAIAGMAFFFLNVWWIAPVTIPGYITMSIYLGLYWALAGWVIHRLVRVNHWPAFVAVPVVWAGLEYLRAWMVTGFPWFFLGHSQVRNLAIIQVADLVGAYGVTFLVAMVNGFFAELIYQVYSGGWRTRRGVVAIAVVLPLLSGAFIYGVWRLGQDTVYAGPRLAVVQEDFPLTVNGESPSLGKSLSAHLKISREAAGQGPAMIVWPETSIGISLNPEYRTHPTEDEDLRDVQGLSQQVYDVLSEHAREAQAHLIVGAISKEFNTPGTYPEVNKYNSALVFAPDGELADRYDKIHLVLFGEFVPFRYSVPPLYRFLNENMTPYGQGGYEYSLTHGQEVKRFELTAGGESYRYGVAICYEDAMAYLIRRFVSPENDRKQIDFLINISNDGWFNHSAELPQHLQICAFRAVENRVGIARSVNTGISGFIDPTGRIDEVVGNGAYGRGTRGSVVRAIKLDKRVSFYSRYGDWFAIICLAVTAAAAVKADAAFGRVLGRRTTTTP